MKARLFDLSIDPWKRTQRLVFDIDGDFRKEYDELIGKDLELEVKPYRKKRSLNANAYMWELVGQIAEKINLPAREVYRLAIKQVGIYKDFPPLPIREAETLKTVWCSLGIGFQTDIVDYDEDGDSVIIRCYYGSSTYNTKQMTRLLDYVIEDAKALGIDTRTPEEISALEAAWKGVKL